MGLEGDRLKQFVIAFPGCFVRNAPAAKPSLCLLPEFGRIPPMPAQPYRVGGARIGFWFCPKIKTNGTAVKPRRKSLNVLVICNTFCVIGETIRTLIR